MLITLVLLYLLVTIGIGLYAGRHVHNTADFAVAGRHLPLAMIVTLTFATWFGSELVLGIPAKFMKDGLGGIVEDPFGAGMCLILVGLFIAGRLYKMDLLTISDYYRVRYGAFVEIFCSIFIMISYLGWVSAQVAALGLVFNLLSAGAISVQWGMVLGVVSILIYTLIGGMWSVAVTDFIQMIVLITGLLILAWFASDMAGGTQPVLDLVASKNLFRFLPEPSWHDIVFFLAAAVTMMLGSIPQQDVFQRVMSARNVRAATWGPVIGGAMYVLFAAVPIFLVATALIVMPEQTARLIEQDPQKVLPTLVMERMPFAMQVIFFGALLSAIKSCASATLLAPTTTFVENILRHLVRRRMDDRQTLLAMRLSVLVFAAIVLVYALKMEGTSIYEMVSGAYQVPLVGAFVPLVFGLYWKRSTTQGGIASVVLGVGVFLLFIFVPGWSAVFPQQLAGLLAAVIGMVAGSLLPQGIAPVHGHVPHFEGSLLPAEEAQAPFIA